MAQAGQYLLPHNFRKSWGRVEMQWQRLQVAVSGVGAGSNVSVLISVIIVYPFSFGLNACGDQPKGNAEHEERGKGHHPLPPVGGVAAQHGQIDEGNKDERKGPIEQVDAGAI